MDKKMLESLPNFRIDDFLLWPPSAPSNRDWLEYKNNLLEAFKPGDLPAVGFLPMALRKKLSPLTKISCYLLNEILVKLDLDPEKVRLVFASRFGEADNTIQLLRSIRDIEPTSPMAFSRSVHNSALGIFSIATNNKALSSSVSGGKRSVSAGLTEAVIQLYSDPEISEVVFVYADEKMPEDYSPLITKPEVPYGFVCVIKKGQAKFPFIFKEEGSEEIQFIEYLLNL